MEFTGEQVVPGITKQRLIDEDIARYQFATNYARGLSVLDIASGTGMGTAMLGTVATRVVGVDISTESIAYAKEHHQSDNIEYILGSADDSALFSDATFDIIISLETIEHLDALAREAYLANLSRWLKVGGTLILSTPNKRVTSPFRDVPDNEFHVLEFTKEALCKEVGAHFSVEQILGQRQIPKLATIPLIRRFIHVVSRITGQYRTLYTLSGGAEVIHYDANRTEPRIFVLVCKKRTDVP